jgi:hypothetical protein
MGISYIEKRRGVLAYWLDIVVDPSRADIIKVDVEILNRCDKVSEMKAIMVCVILLSGQMRTLQDKPSVRLPQNQSSIPADYGGRLVELKDGPQTVYLPQQSPTLDSHGRPWSIDITNFGSSTVTIVGRALFKVQLMAQQSVHIKYTSAGYSTSQ